MKKLIICFFGVVSFITAHAAIAQGIKWHPGHYLLLNGRGTLSHHFAHIDEIASESVIKGVHLRIWWYELESSKGVYNFSKIDAYLAKLKSLPTSKRLVIRIMDRRFNTTSSSGIVPSYLLSSTYNGGLIRTKIGFAARIWETPVMDRLIALYKAVGKRYNSDPYFEGISTEETTLGLGTNPPSSYSASALKQQYVRLINAVRPAMPETNLFLSTNWLGSGSAGTMSALIQSLVEPQVGAGGPDVMPYNITMGQQVWTGGLGADYRGILAIGNSVESSELGGSLGNYTPKQINDFAYNKLHVTHLFWVRNTWTGTLAQQWKTGILPFLRTNPPIRTVCPSSYGLCVR